MSTRWGVSRCPESRSVWTEWSSQLMLIATSCNSNVEHQRVAVNRAFARTRSQFNIIELMTNETCDTVGAGLKPALSLKNYLSLQSRLAP